MQQRVIEARGIVKHYPLPSRPMARLWSALRGNPAGEPWHDVLTGVDFHVDSGETVGLLGRNGAGKTTLLSILAGILPPSSGQVDRLGRIVPILELGGGFDLARSGRANVIAFCQIFGLREAEIERILPAVEEFADLGDYLDQPCRIYSSGMRSRLAFAAAMELDADLIILDETLAVGDLGFRLKCYEAIRVRQRAGTAFLLVAHNPDTLADLCDRIAVLHEGRLIHNGSPAEAVVSYKRVRLGLDDQSGLSQKATIIANNSLVKITNEQRINLVLAIISHSPINEETLLSVGISTCQRVAIYAATVELSSDLLGLNKKVLVTVSFANRLASGSYSITARLSKREGKKVQTLVYYPELIQLMVTRGGPNDFQSHDILHFGFSATAVSSS